MCSVSSSTCRRLSAFLAALGLFRADPAMSACYKINVIPSTLGHFHRKRHCVRDHIPT